MQTWKKCLFNTIWGGALLPLFLAMPYANSNEQVEFEQIQFDQIQLNQIDQTDQVERNQAQLNQTERSQVELNQSAALIFHNECASKNTCLTAWNKGEEFASLGIGHFIWYPAGATKTFKESFPAFILFMQHHHAPLPAWLSQNPDQANPWPNRAAFLAAYESRQMQALRSFLIHNKPLQARFMLQRLDSTLPSLLSAVEPSDRPHIRHQFDYVANSPMGLYVLMDYVNFKGEGTSLKERYHDKGWGMLQVLEQMNVKQAGLTAIQAFADAADAMLTQRVALSPPQRHEQRWLPGWRKRLATYVSEAQKLSDQTRVQILGNTH